MLTNFYTDQELPIITVRSRFPPGHTHFLPRHTHFPHPTPPPSRKRNTLELVARATSTCLQNEKVIGLRHRQRIRELSLECGREIYVEQGMRKRDNVINLRSRWVKKI